MKAFILTFEATLSLLLALSLVGYVYFAENPSSHANLYIYQVTQDIAEVNAKVHPDLILEFANGNTAPLQEKLNAQTKMLGDGFCYRAEARGHVLKQDCFNEKNKATTKRPFYNNGYFDFTIEVST